MSAPMRPLARAVADVVAEDRLRSEAVIGMTDGSRRLVEAWWRWQDEPANEGRHAAFQDVVRDLMRADEDREQEIDRCQS